MSEEQKNEIREGMEAREEKQLREEVTLLAAKLAESQAKNAAAEKKYLGLLDQQGTELMAEQCYRRRAQKELKAAQEKISKLTKVNGKRRKAGRQRKLLGAGLFLLFSAAALAMAILAGINMIPIWTAFAPGVCAVAIAAVTGWTE